MPWAAFSQAAGGRARPVALLGLSQTLSWGSSFYLPAVLAHPMAADLGLAPPTVYLAFSGALVVSAAVGPAAGRAIDHFGGRPVLMACNGIFALGPVLLALAQGPLGLFAAWALLGLAMGAGLYEAAFATLVKLYGQAARNPITGITLIAGFASTVGWPLSAFIAEHYGWRASCFTWAAIHLAIALPVNLLFIPGVRNTAPAIKAAPANGKGIASEGTGARAVPANAQNERLAFWLVAVFAAATSFVTSAMAAHLPGLLLAAGASAVAALTASALLGPAQVLARLSEFMAARRFGFHPLTSARVATALHPAGVVVLALFGGAPVMVAAFAVLHGAGNGMITIAKGTLPLAIFGPAGYGFRQGLLNVLARGAQAFAPFAFGLTLDTRGVGASIALSGGVSLVALAALMLLRKGPR